MTNRDAIEAIGKAIFARRNGPNANPDWPVGVDRLGYRQEPHVRTVPTWEWEGCGEDALAALRALAENLPEEAVEAGARAMAEREGQLCGVGLNSPPVWQLSGYASLCDYVEGTWALHKFKARACIRAFLLDLASPDKGRG